MSDQTQKTENNYYTHERIQGDLDYRQAQAIGQMMLDSGMISVAE